MQINKKNKKKTVTKLSLKDYVNNFLCESRIQAFA